MPTASSTFVLISSVSLVRHRATVYPLKPAMFRRKLKVASPVYTLLGPLQQVEQIRLSKSNVVLVAHYLSADLERVQRRVTSIIFPDFNYNERLQKCGLVSLKDRRQTACRKLFHQVINDPQHKLSPLLQERSSTEYNLRNRRAFQLSKIKTNRFLNTFIPACVQNFS